MFDESTGDVYAIATEPASGVHAVYHVASGATLANGLAVLDGVPSDIAFDWCSKDLLVTLRDDDRVVRVDQAGVVVDLLPPGTISAPGAIAVDGTVRAAGRRRGWRRLPRRTRRHATLLGSPALAESPSGIAYAGAVACSYGTACPGALGVPAIRTPGVNYPGGTLVVRSDGHLPNTIGLVVYGLSEVLPPLDADLVIANTGACSLLVDPYVVDFGFVDATGRFETQLLTTPAYLGGAAFAQHVVLEALAPDTFSFSDALRVKF